LPRDKEHAKHDLMDLLSDFLNWQGYDFLKWHAYDFPNVATTYDFLTWDQNGRKQDKS
jgi:hypothetical protein